MHFTQNLTYRKAVAAVLGNVIIGVSPYDFLALGLTDRLRKPYFVIRVGTDVTCVLVILIAVFTGFITWNLSHLGIGTTKSWKLS